MTSRKVLRKPGDNEVLYRANERTALFPEAQRYDPIFNQQEIDPELFGEVDGLSDKLFKIKGLGNALVPQIPFRFLSIIKEINKTLN